MDEKSVVFWYFFAKKYEMHGFYRNPRFRSKSWILTSRGGIPYPPGPERLGSVASGALRNAAGGGTDCALGSREWAEPPQDLTALSWGVLNKGDGRRGAGGEKRNPPPRLHDLRPRPAVPTPVGRVTRQCCEVDQ